MRSSLKGREQGRIARHRRVRRKVFGTPEKPRLSVHRSLKHFYVQLVDDIDQKTLFSYSTLHEAFQKEAKGKGVEIASRLGKHFAAEAKAKGFSRVVFDRGGYLYHGRVRAFAEACRKEGLLF